MNLKQIEHRQQAYNNEDLLYNMVYYMKDREVIFMHRTENRRIIRGLYVKSIQYLKYLFTTTFSNPFKEDYNIYVSCAKYNNIPEFSFNLSERSDQTYKWFQNEAKLQMMEYDLLLDFDCRNPLDYSKVKVEVIKVLKIFMDNKVPFSFLPSGNGFHMIIPSEFFDHERTFTSKKPYNERLKIIAGNIKERFSLKFLDMKGIGAYTKFSKCPYSQVLDKTVLPFIYDNIIQSFENWQYKYTQPPHIYDTQLYKRGVHVYNRQNGIHNLREFIDKYLLELEGW